MKKKEFTLVELLAVIVILAIILAIAVPGITRLIESTTKSAFTSDAKKIIKAVENKRLTDENYLPTNLSELNISEANYNNVTFSTIEGKVYIKIIGQNKWEGLTACGTYQNMQAGENVECEEPTGETWLCGMPFTDTRDNKQYTTVKIGTQCWFKQDLRYNMNNCLSPIVTWDKDAPHNACKSNDSSTYPSYHYQWEVAKIACPSGWHLPTDDEWKTLEMYLGMTKAQADATGWRGTDEGTKLKTSAWNGNNLSGFTALPVGYRDFFGSLYVVGSDGGWWSSSPSDSTAWGRALNSSYSVVTRGTLSQAYGLSVRCLLGP